ncbi:DUF2971 domain-containing protein [Paraburkholderia pallida]|uniref:DUF2971 domain-containing protein n=1 Tax=Paraburkholderia pallida TaxID=2547399 RepID=A0A4P7D3H2_9BURK|nr:DUF2971 domain-containing protein [Paraburkholderia pallida]QBR01827.1 DUF2971 domain-containing protein [Paraburkholderia pallida]
MAIIYHYCDPHAFLSIIESKALWLSNARKMFDPRVGDGIGSMLVNALAGNQREPQAPNGAATELLLALNVSRRELFTCCFSGNRDATTQWLNYADRGRGLAIGFDTGVLQLEMDCADTPGDARTAEPQSVLADSERGYVLSPVLYGDDSTLTRHIEALKSLVVDGGTHDRTLRARIAAQACEWLGVVAKDPSFRHEQEWRLVYASPADSASAAQSGRSGPTPHLRWRVTQFGLTSYFKYGFLPEAVREVWIGPNYGERAHPRSVFGIKEHHALRLLMVSHGYDQAEIIEASPRFSI